MSLRALTPTVRAIAWTIVDLPAMVEATGGMWQPDPAADGSLLAEFAGRACYQSWSKPNPATATNLGYLQHILEVGHLSVLEHGTVTMYMTGVSRSFTHELVRHRHFSYSQVSQRYVDGCEAPLVVPPLFDGDGEAEQILAEHQRATDEAYAKLVVRGGQLVGDGVAGTARRKQARQAARAVLPNATETRIVVTGNYRAWRHFIDMRATEHADAEIRSVAIAALGELQRVAPNVFGDYVCTKLPDGGLVAESPYAELS